jgi:Skp family chaperone for outer membrane proteins
MGYVDIERVFQEHPMTKRMKEDFLNQAESRRKNIADIQANINSMKALVVSSSTIISRLKDEIEKQKNQPPPQQLQQATSVSTYTVTASTSVLLHLPGLAGNLASATTSPATTPAAKPVVAAPAVSSGTPSVALSTSTNSQSVTLTVEEKQKLIKDMEDGIVKIKQDIDTKTNDLCKFVDVKKKELDKIEADNTDAVMKDIYSVLDSIAKEEDISIIVDKSQILYGQSVKNLTDKVLDRMRGR